MAEITADAPPTPPAVPWHAAVGARDACNAVLRILRREPLPAAEHYDQDRAESGSVFLAQLLYAIRLANGTDPRSMLPAPGGRGAELARQFILGDVVQVCCPYCGILMMQAVAHLVADRMEHMHAAGAPAKWQGLTAALGMADPEAT